MFNKPFIVLMCPVVRGGFILEKTAPIKIEIFVVVVIRLKLMTLA